METKEERMKAMDQLVRFADNVDTGVLDMKSKLSEMQEEMVRLIKSVDVLLGEITDMRDRME